jgi:hypothetical protein
MQPSRTAQSLAVPACALGVIALVLLGSIWLFNPYPSGAQCETADGYAAIKAHAETNGLLASSALLLAAVGAVVCIAGAVKAAGYRFWFVLGIPPFLGIGLVAIPLLIVSGLYCQN